MSEGWIKLHRKLQDNQLWLTDPFSRGQAWVDLLLLANHKDGHIRIDGQRIEIKRGQTGRSILTLSKRWKWSRGKATRFLKELEKDKQITLKTNTRNSIITICNYNAFQGSDTTDGTTRDTTDGHHVIQQTDTNKNNKNNKNEKNEKNEGDFENFWNLYGKIGNKQQALKSYNKSIKEGVSHEVIIGGLNKYQAYCRAINQEQRYIKHASTWLNNRGWEDEYTIQSVESKQERRSREAKEASVRGMLRAENPDF